MRLIKKRTFAFSVVDEKQRSMQALAEESASLLWNRALTHVLRQTPQDEQSKREMSDEMKEYYQADHSSLGNIEKFRLTYTPKNAIEWYTDEGFLHKQVSKALCAKDIQSVQCFRFYIKHVCTAIEQESLRTKFKDTLFLYCGQQLFTKEINELKKNIGRVISTNGFFSTSRDENVALAFAGRCRKPSSIYPVLFEIEINSSQIAVDFADVAHKSRFKDEPEVLFDLNALFKIVSIQFEFTFSIWKIYMIATNHGPDKNEEYRLSIDKQLEKCSPTIYVGHLIDCEFGELVLARQYFNKLLKALPYDHLCIAALYHNLAHIDYKIHDMNSALEKYTLAYNIRQKQLPLNSCHISSSLVCLGHMCKEKGDLGRAIKYYTTASSINSQNYSENHIRHRKVNESIGLVHIARKNCETSLVFLFRALESYKRVLPAEHYEIADYLGSIGTVYENMNALIVVLDYYRHQHEMTKVCLPTDHSRLCKCAILIVNIHKRWGIQILLSHYVNIG